MIQWCVMDLDGPFYLLSIDLNVVIIMVVLEQLEKFFKVDTIWLISIEKLMNLSKYFLNVKW